MWDSPTLIDLTNLTRETLAVRQGSLLLCMAVSPRGRGVSPRIAGSAPGLQVLLRGCRFSPSAADSAPGPRVLLRGCGFYSGAADSYLYNGRRSLHGALPEGRRTGPFQTGRTDPLPGRGVQVLCKQGARALPEGRGVQVLCRDSARCGRLRKAGAEGIRRGVQKKRAFSLGKSDIFFYFCINWENSELKCRSCMTRRM